MPKLINEKMLAEQLMVSVGTLRNWRSEGEGPTHVKVGSAVRYLESDIVAWLDARSSRSDKEGKGVQ